MHRTRSPWATGSLETTGYVLHSENEIAHAHDCRALLPGPMEMACQCPCNDRCVLENRFWCTLVFVCVCFGPPFPCAARGRSRAVSAQGLGTEGSAREAGQVPDPRRAAVHVQAGPRTLQARLQVCFCSTPLIQQLCGVLAAPAQSVEVWSSMGLGDYLHGTLTAFRDSWNSNRASGSFANRVKRFVTSVCILHKTDFSRPCLQVGRSLDSHTSQKCTFSPFPSGCARRHFFYEYFPDSVEWFSRRLAYTRTTAAWSMIGYVLGLGDRHIQNILIDTKVRRGIETDDQRGGFCEEKVLVRGCRERGPGHKRLGFLLRAW